VLENFGGVALGFHGGPDGFDGSRFADEERATDDTHELAAHERFLLPSAKGFDRFVVRIAEQWKIQLLLRAEGCLGFYRIGAHTESGNTEFIELLFCVTKLGRFDGSTGSVCFGIEKEQYTPAAEIRERDIFAVVCLEREVGSFVADLKHKIPQDRSYPIAVWGAAAKHPFKKQ